MESIDIRGELLERFVRYVKIETTSDRHAETIPSTPCQWDLANLLVEELRALGIAEILFDEHGYIIARVPGSGAPEAPSIGLIAHYDTASDEPGKDVNPVLIERYDGKPIRLGEGRVLDPERFPELLEYEGRAIITTDGHTLLGGDDKAGVAEIMTALSYLLAHPEIPRAPLEIVFTPDEETGHGMDRFPLEQLRSTFCYTFDGDGEGVIETECFYAHKAEVKIAGKVIHIGEARGKLANAVSMAGAFISMLPRSESPEATDGRYGYYCPIETKADLGNAWIEIYLRDFEADEIERRIETLRRIAKTVESMFPGGTVEVRTEKQYINMRDAYRDRPEGIEFLEEAIRRTGIEPIRKIIRGGTDGARLAEKGVPTPNVFNGTHNMHSRLEWVAVPAMERAVGVIVNLARLWAERGRK
jgi:tripeptide aminopeptidase